MTRRKANKLLNRVRDLENELSIMNYYNANIIELREELRELRHERIRNVFILGGIPRRYKFIPQTIDQEQWSGMSTDHYSKVLEMRRKFAGTYDLCGFGKQVGIDFKIGTELDGLHGQATPVWRKVDRNTGSEFFIFFNNDQWELHERRIPSSTMTYDHLFCKTEGKKPPTCDCWKAFYPGPDGFINIVFEMTTC